jgi:hypothetical protein
MFFTARIIELRFGHQQRDYWVVVTQKDRRWWLGEYASELPRPVDPDRPQLMLGQCEGDPLEYIERLNMGEEGSRSAFAVEHGIKPRMDLYEMLPAEVTGEIKSGIKALGQAVNDYLVNELGYVVDRRWGLEIYTIYVIDLSDDVPDPRVRPKGWVYVGQTALDREVRYQNHIDGINAGKGWVTKYHRGFNEELCARYPQVRTRVEAEAFEEQAATELEAEDWNVKGAGRH